MSGKKKEWSFNKNLQMLQVEQINDDQTQTGSQTSWATHPNLTGLQINIQADCKSLSTVAELNNGPADIYKMRAAHHIILNLLITPFFWHCWLAVWP